MVGEKFKTSYVKAGRDGRRPRLCVTWEDDEGKVHEKTRAAEPKRMSALRREAEEWRAELNREWREGEAEREREAGRLACPTVPEAMASYVAERRAEVRRGAGSPGIDLSTFDKISMTVDTYVVRGGSPLAGMRLGDVDRDAMQRWVRHLVSDVGLSASTISTIASVVGGAFKWANDQYGAGLPAPFDGVKLPKVVKQKPNALDRRSVPVLKRWISEGDDPFRTAVALALFAGMRRGECCGLMWCDVDMAPGGYGLINLRHSIGSRRSGRDQYLKDPKNHKSRIVPVSPELAAALSRRRAAMEADMATLYPPEEVAARMPTTFVCGDVKGGWLSTSAVTHRWAYRRERLGLTGFQREQVAFHDLRHTYITYQLYAGVSPLDVAAIVGHESLSMTLDVYASQDPSRLMQIAMATDSIYPDEGPTYELPDGTEATV